MARPQDDLTGRRFGLLVCGERLGSETRKIVCHCDCGTRVEVWVATLRAGQVTTCGDERCRAKRRNSKRPPPGTGVVRSTVVERGQVAVWDRSRLLEGT